MIDVFFRTLEVDPAVLAEFKRRDDAALLGQRVADRRGLKPGDLVEVGPVIANAVGSFLPGQEGFLDNVIFLHLDYLLTSMPGGEANLGIATQHLVRVAPGTDIEALTREIDDLFARDEAPTRTRLLGEYVRRAVGEIEEVILYAQYLGYMAVAVMGLILMNTVFMSAQARRSEFALLQVLGTTRPGLFAVVLTESMLLAGAGAALGLGAVYAGLSWFPLGVGVEGYQVDFLPSLAVVAEGMVLAVGVGLLAGLGPATQSALAPIGNALRPE